MTEKVIVRRSSGGTTSVTVRIVDGDTTVHWTIKGFSSIKSMTASARVGALKALEEARG